MTKTTAELAGQLRSATSSGVPIAPLRNIIGSTDVDLAYTIQAINTQLRKDRGEHIVGKKIGLTSFAVQKQLGVDQPDFGILFNTMQVSDGGKISYRELLQPKAEAEIAFVLKKDLDGSINMEMVIDAIDYAQAAIEIVGSRIENWNIHITDTVADNASASHFVLGEKRITLQQLDLENCKMSMTKNGEVASQGIGSACMGNPLYAVLWLAQTMAQRGEPLRKSEIILSGALGPMCAFDKGDVFEAEIEGLGKVGFECG